MFPTRLLFAPARLPVHVTLFTRASCALCTTARDVLAQAWERKPFEYVEIDVMTTPEKRWKDAYKFNVPVLHVVPTVGEEGLGEMDSGRKLMHRFGVDEVVGALEDVAKGAGK